MNINDLASPVDLAASEHVLNGWITYGAGADLDSAYDDAISSAWFDLGRTRNQSSVIDASLADIEIMQISPLPYDSAIAYAQRTLCDTSRVNPIAIAVGRGKNYKIRRVNVKVTDPLFGFSDTIGKLKYVSDELHDHLRVLVGASDVEILGSVQLRRPERSGFKVVSSKNIGKNVTNYEVFIAGGNAPLSTHRTLSEATKCAKEIARKRDLVRNEEIRLEIRGVITRNESNALLTVDRNRVRQSALLRVDVYEAKESVKNVGWVIAGVGLTNKKGKGLSIK